MASGGGNQSSDEEPDYMSDSFLQQCLPNDVRPSLLHSRADKRKHEILVRQLERNRTKEELEKQRVKSMEDALNVPIAEDNKGFKMLQKMGFKPGSALGKKFDENEEESSSTSRLKEPIKIDIKKGRGGLGQEQHEIEKLQRSHGNLEEFRLRKYSKAKLREIECDLRKAQFACQNLDEGSGIVKPEQVWYWPKVEKQIKEKALDVDDDNEGDDDLEVAKKKRRLDEASDSESEDHDEEDDTEDDEAIPDAFKLETVASYLREKYIYCVWCGVKYESESDLNDSCPGSEKDDH